MVQKNFIVELCPDAWYVNKASGQNPLIPRFTYVSALLEAARLNEDAIPGSTERDAKHLKETAERQQAMARKAVEAEGE